MNNMVMVQGYSKVVPHAFVHFATPKGAKRAIDAADNNRLILKNCPLRASSGTGSSPFMLERRKKTEPFTFSDVDVELGTLVHREWFWSAWKGPKAVDCRKSGVKFVIDPFCDRCMILFTEDVVFSFKATNNFSIVKCDMKMEFSIKDINEITIFKEQIPFVMLLRLNCSPSVYYRTADDDIFVTVPFDLLDDDDPWIRTTDFTSSGAIGRCSSYKVTIPIRFGLKLDKAMNYIKQRRIALNFPVHPLNVKSEPCYESPSPEPFFCVQHKKDISFEVMFLVNAVLHKGIFNQFQLSDDFFRLLKNQSHSLNVASLRHIYSYRRPVFDACKRLQLVHNWLSRNPKLLKGKQMSDDIIEIRRLIITPTKAYCLPPEVELSNRVLRKYKEVADRFLRITFMDEGMEQLNSGVLNYYVAPIVQKITQNPYPQKTSVFKRVASILNHGFCLCGRRYSFLAFSANQLRDRSAWFFAETDKITAKSIRNWMGKFSINNVAKCAARMGQCFSSTYATVDVSRKEVNLDLDDIVRNEYVFSDGIGKLTPDLANEVAKKLQLMENPPSAYQIRYAGCKGVVAMWPGDNDGIRLQLRPSMNKFESRHTVLEVVSWTRFQPGFLNRQIITLLSALDVPDVVFDEMQDRMTHKLNQMHENADAAFDVLTSTCAEEGNVAAMMLSAGFRPQTEPHLNRMLSCLRSAQLKDLLMKTRIFVPSGRWLMGCLDELAQLEHGQCFIQVSVPGLEYCFSKHGARFRETKRVRQIIKGTVVIAKNPCLHPGDVRVLEAVDVPGLHHLVDCLVFPQKGDRPHSNEASGSDLDGDLYFVTWEDDLIPPSRKSWVPMDYIAAEARKLPRDVTTQDIIDFFTKNMVNESLGRICNAHVVHADLSADGALDEKCIKLAELAATAVDFPKTGQLVTMPQDLKPKVYPDFMHKEEFRSYKSEKILGRLYRKIKDAFDDESLSSSLSDLCLTRDDIPYDLDLEIPGALDYRMDAWEKKCSYDGQLNALLGQFKVQSEGEVVTGHFWSLNKYNSRKQGELKEKLKHAYSSLQKDFRKQFESLGPDFEQLTDEEKSMLYEKKASAWYQVTYHPFWVQKTTELKEPEGDEVPARLSFAWIAADYLVRIKVRQRDRKSIDAKKPIDSLALYLVDKI